MTTYHRRPFLYSTILVSYISLMLSVASCYAQVAAPALPVTHLPSNKTSLANKEDGGNVPSQASSSSSSSHRYTSRAVSHSESSDTPDLRTNVLILAFSLAVPLGVLLIWALVLLFVLKRSRKLTVSNYLFNLFCCCLCIRDGGCVCRKRNKRHGREVPINPFA